MLAALSVTDAFAQIPGLGEEARIKWVNEVVFSPDGAKLATALDDWTARLWDLVTGQEIMVFRGHKSVVVSVAFSPDGRTLATDRIVLTTGTFLRGLLHTARLVLFGPPREADAPPDTCPSCKEKCEFLDATCYTPDCQVEGSDHRIK